MRFKILLVQSFVIFSYNLLRAMLEQFDIFNYQWRKQSESYFKDSLSAWKGIAFSFMWKLAIRTNYTIECNIFLILNTNLLNDHLVSWFQRFFTTGVFIHRQFFVSGPEKISNYFTFSPELFANQENEEIIDEIYNMSVFIEILSILPSEFDSQGFQIPNSFDI